MLVSQGGIMLLVRLNADLVQRPVPWLQSIRQIGTVPEPATLFEKGSRLRVTYEWLELKFGRANAIRAVEDTAAELLELLAQ